MKLLALVSFFCISFSFGLHAKYDWKKNGWDKLGEEDKITFYRKSFKNSNVQGVAGAALISSTPGKIIDVLMDHEHKSDWVDKFHSSRTLATPSMLTSVQYAAFSMPFPVSDRDFVYQYKFYYKQKQKMILVDVSEAKHADAPPSKTVGVRGKIIMGKYRLYPRNKGKETYVEVEYLADPKGWLPTWVVNIVQKTWPLKTLKGLRKQVTKPFVKEHPIMKQGFKISGF